LVSNAIIDILTQMGIVVLLCIGFTFTYQIEEFPNFSHVSFALIGTAIAYAMTKLMGLNPYLSLPVSALFCGIIGVGFYVGIVQVIKRRKDGSISLTIAFYALAIVLEMVVNIFGYWVVVTRHETTRGFVLTSNDFNFSGLSGVSIITPLTCVFIITLLYYVLTRTKLGISLRAVSENEDLSAVYGINTLQIHMVSWFIVGALVGIAGSLIPLWSPVRSGLTEELLVTVMAGCIIGGLDNIFGSVVGGALITLFQRGLTYLLMNFKTGGEPLLTEFSMLLRGFEQLIPIILIFVILMVAPEGLVKYVTSLRRRYI
jgi:branched-chain amino acid transport system permease protein